MFCNHQENVIEKFEAKKLETASEGKLKAILNRLGCLQIALFKVPLTPMSIVKLNTIPVSCLMLNKLGPVIIINIEILVFSITEWEANGDTECSFHGFELNLGVLKYIR